MRLFGHIPNICLISHIFFISAFFKTYDELCGRPEESKLSMKSVVSLNMMLQAMISKTGKDADASINMNRLATCLGINSLLY